MRRVLVPLAFLTAGVYAVLLFLGVVMMMPEAQGQLPFDPRIWGYDTEEARDYLAALSDFGRWLYLGPVRLLDSLFPPLLGLLMALLIAVNGRPLLSPVPFLYTAVDLWENARIAEMLRRDAPELAPGASSLTQGKYALLALSVALLWLAWRSRRRGTA